MEDKAFQSVEPAAPTEERMATDNPYPRVDWDSVMERQLQELEESIEEGNRLLGFPPLPPPDY